MGHTYHTHGRYAGQYERTKDEYEEGMSWKTTIPWQAKWKKQKESTEELVPPPLHNIHANKYNHAKDSA